MKNITFTILILLTLGEARAQEYNSILFRVGVGTFSMKRQKEFQQDFKTNSNIPLRTIYSFPIYPTFGGSFSIRSSSRSSVGIWTEYSSTGGRLSYKDYSGYILMDQLLKYFQVGPFFQYRVTKDNSWPIYINILPSVGKTSEKLISELEVSGQFKREQYNLKSINYGFRPGIMIAHNMKALLIQIGIGTELQIHSDLKDIDDSKLVFKTSSGKSLNGQWDGLRLTLGVGFHFDKFSSN